MAAQASVVRAFGTSDLSAADRRLAERLVDLLSRAPLAERMATLRSPKDHASLRNALFLRFMALSDADHRAWLSVVRQRLEAFGHFACLPQPHDSVALVVGYLRAMPSEWQDRVLSFAEKAIDGLPHVPFLRADPDPQAVVLAARKLFERSPVPTQDRWRKVSNLGDGASPEETCWLTRTYLEAIEQADDADRSLLTYSFVQDEVCNLDWINRLVLTDTEILREATSPTARAFPIAASRMGLAASLLVRAEIDEEGLFLDAWIVRRRILESPFGRDRPVILERIFDDRTLAIAETRAYRRPSADGTEGPYYAEFEVDWKLE
jgi:hypothetical protein